MSWLLRRELVVVWTAVGLGVAVRLVTGSERWGITAVLVSGAIATLFARVRRRPTDPDAHDLTI